MIAPTCDIHNVRLMLARLSEATKTSLETKAEVKAWAQSMLDIQTDFEAKEDEAAAAAGFKTPLQCPVCGQRGHIEFTSKKGTPYVSCYRHRVQALLMGYHLHKMERC